MATTEKKTNVRDYHVAVRQGDTITIVATVPASSAEQAIRLAASDRGAGRYVAVPARSWTEITAHVVQTAPVIRLGDEEPQQQLEVQQPEPLRASEEASGPGEAASRAEQRKQGVL